MGEMSVAYSGTGYNDLIPSFEVTGEIPFFLWKASNQSDKHVISRLIKAMLVLATQIVMQNLSL